MKVLVYPHDLGMGGSQTNAIELAAALRDHDVECIVFGRPGALNARIDELGLEFVASPEPGRRPSVRVARAIRGLIAERAIDVVHGYEWPPALEGVLATGGLSGVAPVATVMSMAVAPFIPKWLPLVVGTQQIAAAEMAIGRPRVHLIEPPVDLRENVRPPQPVLDDFRSRWGIGGRPLVVIVSRLAEQMKAEGILTAIDVAGRLNPDDPVQLLIVGDGPAMPRVREAAERVNAAQPATVVLTGELMDPRPAYALADVSIGMGGSALRSLAYGTALIVQGERGFFEALTPQSLPTFKWQGWYGGGDGPETGGDRLIGQLRPLLRDAALRAERGAFSRATVEEFSLTNAAKLQLEVYRSALTDRPGLAEQGLDAVSSMAGFGAYQVGKRVNRLRGRSASDDFNAKPLAARTKPSWVEPKSRSPRSADPIVYFPGVSWNAVPGTDHQLATALSRLGPVIWVDPPMSVVSRVRRGISLPESTEVAPGLTRLSVPVVPGVSRPLLRRVALAQVVHRVRANLGRQTPAAVIAATVEPVLDSIGDLPGLRIFLATDDSVAGASLWGMSARYLHRAREANLGKADVTIAVSRPLADLLTREGRPVEVWPNGADLRRFAHPRDAAPAADIHLTQPIAGVVGQFNERLDLALLHAVQRRGISLLLVGPRYFAKARNDELFAELVDSPGVQWVDRVPPDALPPYLAAMRVGLTPYADTAFNRRSFPLKTLEYLSAGKPVVTSAVPPLGGLDERFVRAARSPGEFADLVVAAVSADPAPEPDRVRATLAGFDWDDIASRLRERIFG